MKRQVIIGLGVLLALLALFAFGANLDAENHVPKQVVIATLLSHPALDQVIASLKEEMTSRGYVEKRDIIYVVKNANGNVQLAATIAGEAASLNPDAVVPITTPMAQAVVKMVKAPIVFSAVTDPVGAKIVPSLEKPGPQITGVSDAWPYEDQLKLLREILPSVRTVGVLFNPGDAASQYGMGQVRTIAARLNLTIIEGACNTPSEVGTVAESLVDRVDALYLSSDATVISGFAAASRVSFRARKPLIVGDSGTVEQGGLATVSVGYVGVGRETAALLDRVLKGQRNVPVTVARGDEIYLNTKAAERTGVSFPPELLKRAKKVYTTIP
jgi:putative ABC transport system substrate-binding protein